MIHFVYLKAEEFQGVVQVMREFLPQAEAELKFKALPEDEVAIIQLIEKHEVRIWTNKLTQNYRLSLND